MCNRAHRPSNPPSPPGGFERQRDDLHARATSPDHALACLPRDHPLLMMLLVTGISLMATLDGFVFVRCRHLKYLLRPSVLLAVHTLSWLPSSRNFVVKLTNCARHQFKRVARRPISCLNQTSAVWENTDCIFCCRVSRVNGFRM